MKPRGTQTSNRPSFTTSGSVVQHSTDPQSDVARARSWAAIYVQDFDAPCVLQFAWISALCCALHRSTSLVIHRSGSYNNDNKFVSLRSTVGRFHARARASDSQIEGNFPINSRTSLGVWVGRAAARVCVECERSASVNAEAKTTSHTRTTNAHTTQQPALAHAYARR